MLLTQESLPAATILKNSSWKGQVQLKWRNGSLNFSSNKCYNKGFFRMLIYISYNHCQIFTFCSSPCNIECTVWCNIWNQDLWSQRDSGGFCQVPPTPMPVKYLYTTTVSPLCLLASGKLLLVLLGVQSSILGICFLFMLVSTGADNILILILTVILCASHSTIGYIKDFSSCVETLIQHWHQDILVRLSLAQALLKKLGEIRL